MIQPTNAYPNPTGGANAVAINIYNPQAYGSVPQNASNVPYGYTSSFYNVPEASMYNAQAAMPQGLYQQYIPATSPIVAPTPQVMPTSVLETPTQQSEVDAADNTTPVEVVSTPADPANQIDVDGLAQGLNDADADKKAETINTIAQYVQDTPEKALQVVSEPVMRGLINVINEDTTNLEGPTEQQIAIAEKINRGEQLTPEEDALAEQLSPRDKANKNRIFALYTLSMIQKLQRDELAQYIESQKANGQEPIPQCEAYELLGYNDMINVANNDSRPEVQTAAIQALQYITTPEDVKKQDELKSSNTLEQAGLKTTITDTLIKASNSQDEAVKSAAAEAMTQLGISAK